MLRLPDYVDTLDLLGSCFSLSQLLFTGLRADLFDALGDNTKSADELSRELGLSTRGVSRLADGLASLGLLIKANDRYANSIETKRHLLRSSPESRRAIFLHNADMYERWGQLLDVVATGEAPECAADPASGIDFALAMADVGRRSAQAVIDKLSYLKPRRLLDLGGGPGVYAVAFAARFPDLSAVVFDRADAVSIAGSEIRRAGLSSRVTAIAGDLFTSELGQGFDLVLLSNVVHMYDSARCEELVGKAARTLCPGGTLCIKDFVVDEARIFPPGAAIFAVQMLLSTKGGTCYTVAEITGWLESAGLCVHAPIDLTAQSRLLLGQRSATEAPQTASP